MPTPTNTLQFLYIKSYEAYTSFKGAESPVKRYSFNALEKLFKVTSAIKQLYKLLDTYQELEFSLGILIRAICMDSIQVLYLRHLIFSGLDKDFKLLKEEIKQQCEIYLNDGTEHIINGVVQHPAFTPEDKQRVIQNILNALPDSIDFSNNFARKKKHYKYKISDLYNNSKHPSLFNKAHIVNTYMFYSKYDHLSHWTAMSSTIDFEKLKASVESSFVIMLFQLKDLLAIVYDFDNTCKHLLPIIDEVHEYVDEVVVKPNTIM